MKKPFSLLRPWLVPAALVVLAVVFTVPWSYVVLKAAYDRDVTDNARALARRVEMQREVSRTDNDMASALNTEVQSDPSVQVLIFFNIGYSEPVSSQEAEPEFVKLLAIVNKPKTVVHLLSREHLLDLRHRGMERFDDEQTQTKQFYIPWHKNGRVIGVTYVELSNAALTAEFWKKEAPLLWRVIAWSSTGILIISIVGIFAYHAWQKASHVRQRSELAQQGLLAERGLTAAVLAHEIRNPLQALRFQLHSLRKNADDPQRIAGTAETIDSELLRIGQLVTDYLEHERAAAFRVQSVDLQEAAFKLKTVMDELLRNSGTRLTIEAPSEPVNVTCDPHALRQILMNLVLNAQQAMGSGGAIVIRIGRDDPFGTIDLTDTGPGIPQEMLARLFKPFQSTKKEGHGIGLALVKRFVDNFGGSVTVDSEVGKGTTFHLRLPLADQNFPQEPTATLNNVPEPQKIDA